MIFKALRVLSKQSNWPFLHLHFILTMDDLNRRQLFLVGANAKTLFAASLAKASKLVNKKADTKSTPC